MMANYSNLRDNKLLPRKKTISYIPCLGVAPSWSCLRPPVCSLSKARGTPRWWRVTSVVPQPTLDSPFVMFRPAHWPGLPFFDCYSDFPTFFPEGDTRFYRATQDFVSNSGLEEGNAGSCVTLWLRTGWHVPHCLSNCSVPMKCQYLTICLSYRVIKLGVPRANTGGLRCHPQTRDVTNNVGTQSPPSD